MIFGLQNAQAEIRWVEKRDKHFVLKYSDTQSEAWAVSLLQHAEQYYRKIADNIGYARYQNFWTWDSRALIVVYPTQEDFVRETRQPAWAKGGSFARDMHLFQYRIIITYDQEENFLDGVLPHEITHLMMRDFIGFGKNIPRWLEEGTAQLQEKGKLELAKQVFNEIIVTDRYIPLASLLSGQIHRDTDIGTITVFYSQSVLFAHYLLTKYGTEKFVRLCQGINDGRSFEQVFEENYLSSQSLSGLEKQWLEDQMKNSVNN